MEWIPIFWTCVAFSVWLSLQIGFENWHNERTSKKQRDKFLSGASRSLNLSQEKIDCAPYGDEIWEKWNRYILDYASQDKWENRFADVSGVAFLPFTHLWKVGYAIMAIFTIATLMGETDSEEWILSMFCGMAVVRLQTILAILLNVVTELITGRLPLESRMLRNMMGPDWQQHLKAKEAREYLDARGLPY